MRPKDLDTADVSRVLIERVKWECWLLICSTNYAVINNLKGSILSQCYLSSKKKKKTFLKKGDQKNRVDWFTTWLPSLNDNALLSGWNICSF